MFTLTKMLRKARSVLLRRGVSFDDVEDLVHEAFVRVAEYERAEHVRSSEAMLITTAVNISIDRERQRRRRAPFSAAAPDLETLVDSRPGPEDIATARDRLRRVGEGLNQLNEKSRRILLARRLEDVSVAEIARREGMSVAAVEKQIARATMRLMKWMDE